MQKRIRRWRCVAAAACLLGLVPLPASAMVTLETQLSGIRCGITGAGGETVYSQCDTLSFGATLHPGDTAFLYGTLVYHYDDDGLPLPYPQRIQLDTFGYRSTTLTHEGAVLHFGSSACGDPRFCPQPALQRSAGTPFSTLVLGGDDQPDDFWGSQQLFATAQFVGGLDPQLELMVGLSAGWSSQVFTAPIPEPATTSLMAAGLLALGWFVRRRRARP